MMRKIMQLHKMAKNIDMYLIIAAYTSVRVAQR
jgi:hypothetical protein